MRSHPTHHSMYGSYYMLIPRLVQNNCPVSCQKQGAARACRGSARWHPAPDGGALEAEARWHPPRCRRCCWAASPLLSFLALLAATTTASSAPWRVRVRICGAVGGCSILAVSRLLPLIPLLLLLPLPILEAIQTVLFGLQSFLHAGFQVVHVLVVGRNALQFAQNSCKCLDLEGVVYVE